jgi:HEAT repeat protein
LLVSVLLDSNQHADIRAGAAWSLGELHNKLSMAALIDSFTAMYENVRVEAARALVKLASLYTPEVLYEFSSSSIEKRAGIAWALSKSGCFSIEDMLNALVDEDARQWVSFILGSQDQQKYIHDIELLKERDPEVYFAVTVLWKIMSSWVYNLEVY